MEGQSSVMALLLAEDRHSKGVRLSSATDREGRTPLHLAAMHGHDATVRVILGARVFNKKSRRVQVDPPDTAGFSSVEAAAQRGHLLAVRALLEVRAGQRRAAAASEDSGA